MEPVKAKVMKSPTFTDYMAKTVLDEKGCMVWQGATTNKGYGHVKYKGAYWLIHRLVYTLCKGPIPKHLVVRHTCDNVSCINPDHLLVGTPQENVYDQIERGRLKPRFGKCQPVEWYRNIRDV